VPVFQIGKTLGNAGLRQKALSGNLDGFAPKTSDFPENRTKSGRFSEICPESWTNGNSGNFASE